MVFKSRFGASVVLVFLFSSVQLTSCDFFGFMRENADKALLGILMGCGCEAAGLPVEQLTTWKRIFSSSLAYVAGQMVGIIHAHGHFKPEKGMVPLDREKYDWIYERVERLSKKAHIEAPSLWVWPADRGSACVRGLHTSGIVLADNLLTDLSPDELETVIGHEIGHIVAGDSIRNAFVRAFAEAMMCLYGIQCLGLAKALRAYNAPRGLGTVFSLISKPVCGLLSSYLIHLLLCCYSRYRELCADRASAQLTGKPEALVSALAKVAGRRLESERQASLFRRLGATHPPFWQRLQKLQQLGRSLKNRFFFRNKEAALPAA